MAEIERIVFMQGDGADEALSRLDEEGIDGALEYLKSWHYPGEHETSEETSAGTSDHTHETDDGYILTWNNRIGYIGLEYRVA